ncbi:hypothetical protein DK459_12625 [Achromobacter sp. RW408]|uniref:hypothetical protein n=1 Tax=Achromobacter sp. RW408 TaxID=2202897 RepID=UPI000D730E10|nr:hypothetical protein [Achromobacter sp. RW408]PWY49347.1 hypothetical protein DK459_12625 [Achromobacter sp. RW408]
MKTFVQILDGRVHWKFQSAEVPNFPPSVELVDVTEVSPQPREGWLYQGGQFVPAVQGVQADPALLEALQAVPEAVPVLDVAPNARDATMTGQDAP